LILRKVSSVRVSPLKLKSCVQYRQRTGHLKRGIDPRTDTFRAKVAQYLNDIKKMRNRMSHHEPVWSSALPRTPAGVHAYMTQQVRQMAELIGAMSQDALMLLHSSGAVVRIDSLLQPQTIASYAVQGAANIVDPRRLKRAVRKLAQNASR
jgi:hypothetical protein